MINYELTKKLKEAGFPQDAEKDNGAQKEAICNHFMVWNIQGGYSYYRCDKCNYIDGEETFRELREEIGKLKESK